MSAEESLIEKIERIIINSRRGDEMLFTDAKSAARKIKDLFEGNDDRPATAD